MNNSKNLSFGQQLRNERKKRGLTQREVARLIEVPDVKTVSRWEQGFAIPQPRYRQQLAELFGLSAAGLGLLPIPETPPLVSFRITEEPLAAQNLLTCISALTELSTKYWLIAKGRFADLIEYTQTHNDRLAEEANIVVTRITYNSPMNMDWKVDLSAPSVAEALITTIDGITQRQVRLEKAKLEIQAKALEIKEDEQKSEHESQMALLEQEKQRLELEQRRLEVLEKRLEVQKKGIEYALEIAEKVVDTLHPGADQATRTMEIQALLPNLLQLQSVKGLELVLPTSPS
jgi:transcriptional regulator with XRE-family HTH domain